jgi:hypothetical protein
MIRLLLAVLSICLFLPLASVHAQDAAEPDASNAMSQLVQQANENGMTVIILDGNGSPMEPDAANEAVEEINEKNHHDIGHAPSVGTRRLQQSAAGPHSAPASCHQ